MAEPRFRSLEVSDTSFAPEGFVAVTVKSPALRARGDILIYRPPWSRGAVGVPVILLLHGAFSSGWAWAWKGGAHRALDAAISARVIAPAVLVMPTDGLWDDGSGYVTHASQDFEGWIADDVPDAVEAVCSEVNPQSKWCIAGLSMGGFGALRLACAGRRRFAAAAGMSSVTDLCQFPGISETPLRDAVVHPAQVSIIASLDASGNAPPPLSIDCGLEDSLLEPNRALHAELLRRGVTHFYSEFPGGHTWDYWRARLPEVYRFFGKALC
jgi:putative tributyrin esterase